jgi:hypothetical protein
VLRSGRDRRAAARVHGEYGLAAIALAAAAVAWTEAEDARDLVRAARCRAGLVPVVTGDDAYDGVWEAHQQARLGGDPELIEAARDTWRRVLVAHLQAVAARKAAEDDRHFAVFQQRADDADRVDRGRLRGTPAEQGRRTGAHWAAAGPYQAAEKYAAGMGGWRPANP